MRKTIFARSVLGWIGLMLPAQQLLFVSPPGGIVKLENNAISVGMKELSTDEQTFKFEGRVYPNAGPAWVAMRTEYPIKFNVADHFTQKDGQFLFDGVKVEVGTKIERINKALRWGEQIACLALIPHKATHWLEPKRAHALIIFSPRTGLGVYQGLYLEGKASCDLWLLDPVDKGK